MLTNLCVILLFSAGFLSPLHSQGDNLVFPFESEVIIPTGHHFYMFDASSIAYIVDEYGTPVYLKYFDRGIRNFKPLTDSTYTCYLNTEKAFLVLDQQFIPMDTLVLSGNFDVDFHSISQLDNGNIIMLGYELTNVDLSETIWSGSENATIRGAVIQEKNQDGEVLYQWKSLDHLGITDSTTCLVDMQMQVIDYLHVNSIQSDTDSTWIISARNLNQVLRIHKTTGQILWRLGGIGNQFAFQDDPTEFSAQHSVFLHDNGEISMYDNGNCKTIRNSRGLVYIIDQEKKIVEKVAEFYHDPPIFASSMGNFNRLPGERNIVGWGKGNRTTLFTEYQGSNTALEMSIREGFSFLTYVVSPVEWNFPVQITPGDAIDFGDAIIGDTLSTEIRISNDMDIEVRLIGMHFEADFFEFEEELPIPVPSGSSIVTRIRCIPTSEGNWETPLTIYSEFDDGDSHLPKVGSQVDVVLNVSGPQSVTSFTSQTSFFRFFPNPVDDFLNFETRIPVETLRIYGNTGILKAGFGNFNPGFHSIPTAHLSSGIYIIVVTGKNGASYSGLFTR